MSGIDKCRIVDGSGIPDDGILSSEVTVGEDISKAGDGPPRNLWQWIGEYGGEVFYGFANDLQISCHGIYRSAVSDKGIKVEALNIAIDGGGGLDDVLKA